MVLYFAYGSNLWLDQMSQRCPHSTFISTAYLPDYQWIISSRKYANIIPSCTPGQSSSILSSPSPPSNFAIDKGVFGFLYDLTTSDEKRLDKSEGVPWAYEKKMMDVVIVQTATLLYDESNVDINTIIHNDKDNCNHHQISDESEIVKALVYINPEDYLEGIPWDEYIHRMNCGFRDAVKKGIPVEYVNSLRRFIPEEEEEVMKEQADQMETET